MRRRVGLVSFLVASIALVGCGDDADPEGVDGGCSGSVVSTSESKDYCVFEGGVGSACPAEFPTAFDGSRGVVTCGPEDGTVYEARGAEADYWRDTSSEAEADASLCEAVVHRVMSCNLDDFVASEALAECAEPSSEARQLDLPAMWSCFEGQTCGGLLYCIDGRTPPSVEDLTACVLDNGYLSPSDPVVPESFVARCESIEGEQLCDPNHYMTEEGALCVAALWGLEVGVEPWRAELGFYTDAEGQDIRAVWTVSTTTSSGASSEGTGISFDPNSGEYVATLNWAARE